ncbi:hypothetical protein [Rhodoferax saidenbachensis]|uniref:Glycosyl transferase family 1 domain-containing protein n=1 Tax=Rhodoferax saidenbachensis TaxID=1484693 RepID=A0A1P8K6H0_9BURK|nr:hypothetical protein [Rhodoferax saidenbachensis]APW41605.1 hypothetical protein RS694_02900 [Rhodoferax saidenbachensis]
MFANLPLIEPEIDNHIAGLRYNEALANIMVGVHGHHKLETVARNFLYYPKLDQQMQTLSEVIFHEQFEQPAPTPTENTLIVASEIYQVGGHSRVIADLVKEVPSPTLVLTDMYWRFRNTPDYLNWVLDAFAAMPVIVLPQRTLWAKCQALGQLTRRLNPKNIFYVNHHEDPIPFVGTLGHVQSNKTLIHHCDHNPSLGSTLEQVAHVDFVEEMAHVCSTHLHRPAWVLPLFVPDGGLKSFRPIENNNFSAVTCGTHVKYIRTGPMALQCIVASVLESLDGQFFHIGELGADWIAEIRVHLQNRGIAPERFVALGNVTSLWETLLHLDAHVYIGSAPIGGGRAAIEAQGCGYPVLFYRVNDQGPAIGSNSLYASKSLEWSDTSALPRLLKEVVPQHASFSALARTFYVEKFSQQEFARVVREVCASRDNAEGHTSQTGDTTCSP